MLEGGFLGNVSDEKVVDTEHVKCSSCGSNMVFDPDKKSLYCAHCGFIYSFADGTVAKECDLSMGFDTDTEWSRENTCSYECSNCGAKVVMTEGETSSVCPFCGTHYVKETKELKGIKPHGVIPFTFGEEKAIESVKFWAKKRLFAPRKFKKNLTAEKVKGIYLPCFTFDSKPVSYYNGRVGTRHTRVVGSGKNRRTETYIIWRNISGVYYSAFDDVLVSACSKLNQNNLEEVMPFDTNASNGYQEEYMLGFMAYHYDYELTDCWGLAKTKMDARIRQGILAMHRYDVLDYLDVSTNHEAVTYKYVMLPIYVGNYSYRKKVYNFFINGSTGKVSGKTPKSVLKILSVVLGLTAVVLLLAWLLTK